jgi:Rod binding domain-containing protein
MTANPIGNAVGRAAGGANEPSKVRDAAEQFEALLVSQILRTVRESGSLSSSDPSSDCALGFAEEQFAVALAKNGGLGLADLIAKGLERRP